MRLTFRNNSYKLRIAGPVLTEHGHGPRHYRRGASHRLRHAFTSHKGLSPHQAATMVKAHTVCTVDPPRPDLRPPTRITLLLRSNAVYMRCLQLQLPQTPELNGSAFCGSAERSKTE